MKQSNLNVLFLTRYPIEGASSRYRVYQYIKHLESQGVNCQVQSFMSTPFYRLSFSEGRVLSKIWETLKAVSRRVFWVLKQSNYDIIYMQRELLPFGPPLLERWMKRKGAILFFDYDDALFLNKPSRYNPIATFFRSPGKVIEVFKLVDLVVAGNNWLRDEAVRYGATAVTLEVAEDTQRIRMHEPHNNASGITIGWLGSTSTVKYLNILQPVLQQISSKYPQVSFEIMGGGDFAMEGVPWQVEKWTLEGETAALARYDIGLMPLPMEDWAKGKSGGKARTYMAAGVVPVCTAIGYNLELIEHGRTGFLCTTAEEWLATLSQLIEDPALRQHVAVAARMDVEERFSPVKQAAKLRELFDSAVEEKSPLCASYPKSTRD